MSLRDRIEQLEPREQRLLALLVGVFAVMVVLLIPVLLSAMVASRQEDNEQLRAAIEEILASRDKILKHERERQAVLDRYARPAPALAGYLAKVAKANDIEIPESQDRPVIPHGKKYEERSTKLVLRKVGMKAFANFLEQIENSGYPVRVSSLNLRKRTEADSYDVNMTVSAFDRKAEPPGKKDAKEKQGEGEAEGDKE